MIFPDRLLGTASIARSQNYIYNNGQYSILPISGDLMGINDSGELVGTGPSDSGGFSYNNGIYTPIIVPGSSYTAAIGINNFGQIVGDYSPSGGGPVSYGFSYIDGAYTSTNVPGLDCPGILPTRKRTPSTTPELLLAYTLRLIV